MSHRRLLPLTLLALLAPAGHAAAGWSPDRAQTRAGDAGPVHAAGGNGDRVALTWQRSLDGTQRAEVRLGRARDGFTRAPQVLDRSPNSIESPLPAYVRDGAFAVAWRRFDARFGSPNQRIRTVVLDRNARPGATTSVTTTGESAFDLRWVGGLVPTLIWSRTTRADAREFAPTGPRAVRLPVAPRSEPGAATDDKGLAAVSWVDAQRVLVSERAGTGFGPPANVAMGDVNRTAVIRAGGSTLVFWRQGVDLEVSVRPPGGVFGPPRPVLADTTDAAQVAVTRTGEVLVVAPVGDSSNVGLLTLVRLGADGAPLGPPLPLGRGRRPQLAADGTGSAFVAWMGESATRQVTVRRVAAGGILGRPIQLAARSDFGSTPALGATREGGAVVAWTLGGDVHARTYRP